MGIGIIYLKGDATNPIGSDNKIIVHVCNDIGGWGKGFVLALSKKWKEPETAYRKWAKEGNNFILGEVQFVPVEDGLQVANMIGQHGVRVTSAGIPLRYEALESCLQKAAQKAIETNSSIHMPRIGCGLAGGKWEFVEPIIIRQLYEKGIKVYVYDFE